MYAGAASGGYSLGLVVGGVLTAVSWRWVFFAPAMMAASILLLGLKLIVDSRRPPAYRGFDLLGALIVTGAMLFAAVGITRLEHPGTHLSALAAFAASAALWVILVLVERRTKAPLIRLSIFRSGSLVRANLSMLLFGGSFFGFQFVVTLYLQELLGWTPLQTGLALIVVSVDAILAPTFTPILVSRFGHVRVIAVGLAMAAVAYALFMRLDLDWTYAAMFPTMLILGVGFALAYGPLTIVATNGVVESQQGLASSLINTSFQFGAGLGLSAVGALVVLGLAGEGSIEDRLEALRLAMLVPVSAAALAVLLIATGRPRTPVTEVPRQER